VYDVHVRTVCPRSACAPSAGHDKSYVLGESSTSAASSCTTPSTHVPHVIFSSTALLGSTAEYGLHSLSSLVVHSPPTRNAANCGPTRLTSTSSTVCFVYTPCPCTDSLAAVSALASSITLLQQRAAPPVAGVSASAGSSL
jgi:hypothetical protein